MTRIQRERIWAPSTVFIVKRMNSGPIQAANGNPTSNCAGVSYEVVIYLCDTRVLWIARPNPASTHDITIFCGGTQVSQSQRNNKANWDWNALYFKIPEGKKLIGDSGYKG